MILENLISSSYQRLITLVHRDTKWGKAGASHLTEIVKFAEELKAVSILDYGCGRGSLKAKLLQMNGEGFKGVVPVIEFDPGIPGKTALPKACDLLVATDVLEHIEPDRVDVTLAFLRTLSRKGAFFVISLNKAHLTLPDGQNAHLTIRTDKWWLKQLKKAGFDIKHYEKRKGLFVWAK